MVCHTRHGQGGMAGQVDDLLTSIYAEFSLKLPHWGIMPGITIPIISYWDGQPLR